MTARSRLGNCDRCASWRFNASSAFRCHRGSVYGDHKFWSIHIAGGNGRCDRCVEFATVESQDARASVDG